MRVCALGPRLCALALLSVVVACRAIPPSGIFGCDRDLDCPPRQRCIAAEHVCAATAAAHAQPVAGEPASAETPQGSQAPTRQTAGEAQVAAGSGGTTSNPRAGAEGESAGAGASAAGNSAAPPAAGRSSASAPINPPMDAKHAAAGDACSSSDERACGGVNDVLVLLCNGSRWTVLENCGTNARCGSQAAMCRPAVPACVGAQPGARVCVGNEIHECSADPASTRVVERCGGNEPECQNGDCVCLTRCDGVCVSLMFDAEHCGRCDHQCPAVRCEAGVCQAAGITQAPHAVRGLSGPSKIGALYWIDNDDKVIYSVGAAGNAPRIAVSLASQASELLVSGSELVFIASNAMAPADGAIMQAAPGEMARVLVGQQPSPRNLRQASGVTYWTTSDGVLMRLRAGASGPEVLRSDNVYVLAVNDATLVWVVFGTEIRSAAAGSTTLPIPSTEVTVLATVSGMVNNVWLDATTVYVDWTDDTKTSRSISSVPVSGGPLKTIVSASAFYAVALDGEYIYWLGGPDDLNLKRIRKTGGDPETLVPTREFSTSDRLAFDDRSIYFSAGRGIFSFPK